MDPSPLYSPLFKLGRKPSPRAVPVGPDFPSTVSASLDRIKAAVRNDSLDAPTRRTLEEQLIQIIVMGVKAEYSADDVLQMFMDAVRDLDPNDPSTLETEEDDIESGAEYDSILSELARHDP